MAEGKGLLGEGEVEVEGEVLAAGKTSTAASKAKGPAAAEAADTALCGPPSRRIAVADVSLAALAAEVEEAEEALERAALAGATAAARAGDVRHCSLYPSYAPGEKKAVMLGSCSSLSHTN